MKFEHDLFISYTHLDNTPLKKDEKGWVSSFHHILETRITQVTGKPAKVWRDLKLAGDDYFDEVLAARLAEAAALVSIVSPLYVNSEWCQIELERFCEAAKSNGGLRVADKGRIFGVIKTPVDPVPERIRPMPGYNFFVKDDKGRPRELSDRDATFDEFKQRIDDLAWDIKDLLELIRGKRVIPTGTVFLGETSSDLHKVRDEIQRDLVRNGYEVRPNRPFPLVLTELDAFLREELALCKLSIHLIGRSYGVIPEGASESIVERQQRLATEVASNGNRLTSLIWVPSDRMLTDTRQEAFINRLRTDSGVHATAELLETAMSDSEMRVEKLKSRIYAKLEPPPAPFTPAAVVPSNIVRVYLICDHQDLAATTPLADALYEKGYDIVLPIIELDEAKLRLVHEDNLKTCDAAILFHATAGEFWLQRKMSELRKSAGLGREKPWFARAIYLGPQSGPEKPLRTREFLVIHQGDSLDPFTAEIEKNRGPQ